MKSKLSRWIRSGLLTVVSVLWLTASATAYSQASQQKPTRQSALEAFSKEDYENALTDFNYLITQYPKDPQYKYYSGVCLVKLERDPQKASQLLSEAVSAAAGIRSVPADCQFWLGRALQMSGEFDKAVGAYNSFASVAGKKSSREMGVADYIQQAQNKKGMITVSAATIEGVREVETPVPAAIKPVEKEPEKITGDKSVSQAPLPAGEDRLLGIALAFRRGSDSLAAVSSDLRKSISSAPASERDAMLKKAASLEIRSEALRDSADRYMALFMKKPVDEQPEVVKPPEAVKKVDTPVVETPPVAVTLVFSSFDIVAVNAKGKEEHIKPSFDIPPGLVYRIQLAVFRNPVAVSYFKGIIPITAIKNPGNGITTYFGGLFRRSSDASNALSRVKSLGFRDAFVTAHMDNKQVSAERAAYLEKEWGSKPLFEITAAPASRDTVPPTLVLRVEIMRSSKPLPADRLDEIKKLSGTRGMDILVNDSKQNIYLIGKFLTFKSATEYCDLLVRNGYRDAKVVAYLGQREIPIETARQLFDQE